MSRRRLLIALVVVLVGGVATGLVIWPRGTTEISHDEALDDFRQRSSTTAEADVDDAVTATDQAPGDVPEPGVYRFDASGSEEVKLGPLPAEVRPLPATVTAVAVDAGDGCFDWTLNLFAEHTEDTRWCRDAEGLRLASHVKHQKIGTLSPTATLTCSADRVPLVAGEATDLDCELVLDGGPASIRATVVGTARAGEPEEISVAATAVQATPVKITFEVSGDLSGTWVETLWWSDSGLPLRIERALDLAGVATFSESSTLTLADLDPSG